MKPSSKTVVDLETRFWQAMVDQDADAATALLCEPAVMVSAYGAMQFDHASYRKMAEQGSKVVTSFEFDDMKVMFPNDTTAVLTYHVTQVVAPRGKTKGKSQEMTDSSTWIQQAGAWKCVMHTETPMEKKAKSG
ncbi:MAG: nuclear transport factor 2 family protein [Pseudomonadota bacterium]